jgi:hypothetical protein
MAARAKPISVIGIAVLLTVCVPVGLARQVASSRAATGAVRSFYTFHLARNKDFNFRNIKLRKRWLTAELHQMLLDELKHQAEERKTHPDEAPHFEGDPLTDSQEPPDAFRVGKAEVSEGLAKVTVTLLWSARSSRGRDKRDIVIELTKSGSGWLINDIINNQGSRLRDELKRNR